MSTKPNISFIRKQTPGIARQNVTIPKPTMKICGNPVPTILKPKIQITQNVSLTPQPSSSPGGIMHLSENSLKRKREDDVEMMN